MNRVRIPVLMTTVDEHEREIEQEKLGLVTESLEDAYWWIYRDTEQSEVFIDPSEVKLIQGLGDGFTRVYVGTLTSFVVPEQAEIVDEWLS